MAECWCARLQSHRRMRFCQGCFSDLAFHAGLDPATPEQLRAWLYSAPLHHMNESIPECAASHLSQTTHERREGACDSGIFIETKPACVCATCRSLWPQESSLGVSVVHADAPWANRRMPGPKCLERVPSKGIQSHDAAPTQRCKRQLNGKCLLKQTSSPCVSARSQRNCQCPSVAVELISSPSNVAPLALHQVCFCMTRLSATSNS